MAMSRESAWDKVVRPWWAKVGIGVVMIVAAITTYSDFSKLESGERDSLWVGRSTKILYDMGGKGLATAVPLLGGLGMISWGVVQVARKEQP